MTDTSEAFIEVEDFLTHRASWRGAIEKAHASAVAEENADDAAYWTHELHAFDRAFDGLSKLAAIYNDLRMPLERGVTEPETLPVPIDELAEALGFPKVPASWRSISDDLEPYLILQGGGPIKARIRYGAEPDQYMSMHTYSPEKQERLQELAARYSSSPRP